MLPWRVDTMFFAALLRQKFWDVRKRRQLHHGSWITWQRCASTKQNIAKYLWKVWQTWLQKFWFKVGEMSKYWCWKSKCGSCSFAVQTVFWNVDTDVLSRFCDLLLSHNSMRIQGRIVIKMILINHGSLNFNHLISLCNRLVEENDATKICLIFSWRTSVRFWSCFYFLDRSFATLLSFPGDRSVSCYYSRSYVFFCWCSKGSLFLHNFRWFLVVFQPHVMTKYGFID